MAQSSPRSLLVINSGSSSIRVSLFRGSRKVSSQHLEQIRTASQLRTRLRTVLALIEKRSGVPDRVAHRIVHGGQRYHRPTLLNQQALKQLQQLVPLAPLHMPANLLGIRLVKKIWPRVPQWGVFDTALYVNIPDYAKRYAIPLALADKYGIQKYGFHGISHQYAFTAMCRARGRAAKHTNAVTIHLGSGDSMTAWRMGRPIDTSMGFTPLEGLTMATRSGDLDPMVPLFLQTAAGMSSAQVANLLQQRSGMFGISGLKDIRDVLSAGGHPVPGWPRRTWSAPQRAQARLALAMFIYDIQRYLASYLGLLPKPQIIVFTGAVGQNAWVRRAILRGVPIARGVAVTVIPTDEETAIAEAVHRVVQ